MLVLINCTRYNGLVSCSPGNDNTIVFHDSGITDDGMLQVVAVPEVSGTVRTVLFDAVDPNVFMVAEQRSWSVHVYAPIALRGARVRRLVATEADASARPLLLASGSACTQTDTGQIITKHIPALCPPEQGSGEQYDQEILQCAATNALWCLSVPLLPVAVCANASKLSALDKARLYLHSLIRARVLVAGGPCATPKHEATVQSAWCRHLMHALP